MDDRNRITIKVEGAELTLIERRRPTWRYADRFYTQRDWNRDQREYVEAPRMYVSVENETLLENLQNRRRRPYSVYKKLIAASGIGAVLSLEGARWSQNAGCKMCPCSSGFVLAKQAVKVGALEFKNYDVWVKLDGAPNVDSRKPARVI